MEKKNFNKKWCLLEMCVVIAEYQCANIVIKSNTNSMIFFFSQAVATVTGAFLVNRSETFSFRYVRYPVRHFNSELDITRNLPNTSCYLRNQFHFSGVYRSVLLGSLCEVYRNQSHFTGEVALVTSSVK